MTPLARRITKELTLPLKRRSFNDQTGVLAQMGDVHCFECTEVITLARLLGEKLPKHGIDERSTFLPAPKTWLEWKTGRHSRTGFLLVQNKGATAAEIYKSYEYPSEWFSLNRTENLAFSYTPMPQTMSDAMKERKEFLARLDESNEAILALLSIINTPRIIGRRQHMPHRGFERDMVRAMNMVGKFPLHAWTEINLEVAPPKDMRRDPSIEAHYTGKRALHFCRAHLRISLGRLQIVTSHWRGDGSLGIKQSRYKLIVGATHAA